LSAKFKKETLIIFLKYSQLKTIMLEPKAEPQMERCPPPYDTRASTADPRLPVVVLSPANRSKEQPQQITKSAGSKLGLHCDF